MQVYLVGGAVRDRLLGLPVGERDWVVVGARPEELERQGYVRVGKEFPVFLHPETHDEYALARTERKVGPGYTGFTTRFSPDVTLEDDLRRRDLTINAIAEDEDGKLADPFGGRRDLEARVLRHVSEAFVEDPVRVLRLARFAARFTSLGFTIAEETLGLMKRIVAAGEMDALVPERVWKETHRALDEVRPDVYFQTLRDCGALKAIFPEVDALFGVPQPAKWHPEIDTGVHVLMALRIAAQMGASTATRFAVLTHDLGKARTPQEKWPSHHGHEQLGVPVIEAMSERLRVPKDFRDLAVMVSDYHTHVHRAQELKPSTTLELFEKTDAFRRPERFNEFLLACECDARGRLGLEDRDYPQPEVLRKARSAAAAVTLTEADRQGLAGTAIGEKLRRKRLDAIAGV
ncbi:MAG: multifunctional CCA addition/repair protein [Gammaproteobacteria bacterium]